MSNDLARSFLESVSGYTIDDDAPKGSADRPVRLGTVDPAYSGTGSARVTFDGESTMTVKAYTIMEPISASDRVALLPVGQGYVILGKLGGGAWYAAIIASLAADRGFKNHIINGRFRTNQRAYASAGVLASGVYGFDRWKSTTAGTTLTFTALPQGQTVTLNADKSIAQVVERADVVATTYVLSWSGTARGRVYNVGAAAPAYAASGSTWVLDGLTDVVVEFTTPAGATGTLVNVQLEIGTVPTAYEYVPLSVERLACQRFYVRITGTASGQRLAIGYQVSTTQSDINFILAVPMRAAPTLGVSNCWWTDGITANSAITAVTAAAGVAANPHNPTFYVTFGAMPAGAPRSGQISATAIGSYLELTAEL